MTNLSLRKTLQLTLLAFSISFFCGLPGFCSFKAYAQEEGGGSDGGADGGDSSSGSDIVDRGGEGSRDADTTESDQANDRENTCRDGGTYVESFTQIETVIEYRMDSGTTTAYEREVDLGSGYVCDNGVINGDFGRDPVVSDFSHDPSEFDGAGDFSEDGIDLGHGGERGSAWDGFDDSFKEISNWRSEDFGGVGLRDKNRKIHSAVYDNAQLGLKASLRKTEVAATSVESEFNFDIQASGIELDDSVQPSVNLEPGLLPGAEFETGHFDQLNDESKEYAFAGGFYVEMGARIGIGLTPGLNDLADAVEFGSGYDFLTGEKLALYERALSGVGLVLGSGQLFRAGLKVLRTAPTALIGRLTRRFIVTPYHTAYQGLSREALNARRSVLNSFKAGKEVRVYRIGKYGSANVNNAAGAKVYHWSLENPLTTPDFARRYGIFTEGNDFVEIGTLKMNEKFITRVAGPGEFIDKVSGKKIVNPGGGIEIVTNPGSIGPVRHINISGD